MKMKKIISIIVLIIVLLNFFLFIFTVISWIIFLGVLGLAYLFVKFGLPRMK